jgi:pimeloyl-ACP methyl ester carboxylesterase
MPRVKAGVVAINYVEHGAGEQVVLAIHGNLGCADWLDLVLPLLPDSLHVFAAEWRGCGDSDKPDPAPDYVNYSMATHAQDMLGLLDALGIARCDLFGHSTGGIICSHMLAMQPERFGKVLLLDPVTPFGLQLAPGQLGTLVEMKADHDAAFAGLATAAPTLFRPETLLVGERPRFRDTTSHAQRRLFARLVDMTRVLSDGIWFGTVHDLACEWDAGTLAAKMPAMTHEHLLLYGKLDYWIPREHLDRMAKRLANCRLEVFPYVGHSMCIEVPLLLARVFTDYFRAARDATQAAGAGATHGLLQ